MIKFFRPKSNKVNNEAFNGIYTPFRIHKTLKALVVNLLLLCLLFLFVESVLGFYLVREEICFSLFNNSNNDDVETKDLSFLHVVKNVKEVAHYKYIEQDFNLYFYDSEIRPPAIGKDYKDKNIILAGCSFSFGANLEYKDSFGSVLTKIFPKYKVYNIGISGASPREALYILRNYKKYQNQKILPSIKEEDDVKFFIYTTIYDQKSRLFKKHKLRIPSPLFKIKKINGEKHLSYYNSYNPLYRTYTYTFFAQNYMPSKIFDKYMKDLFTLYMKEIKKEVDKIYPNATFVLFVYSYQHENNATEFDLKAIENLGIKVVELNKISKINFGDEKYRMYDYHPSKHAWREIVPLLGKELNL